MPPSRRCILRSAAALAPALLLPACGGSNGAGDSRDDSGRPLPEGAAAFDHGVASGDPLADRVMLWTRVSEVDRPTPVRWWVATDPGLTSVVRSSGDGVDAGRPQVAGADTDYTFKVDVSGLQPGTTYYYQFEATGVRSPVGRTRTLPTGAPARARLGLAACSNFSNGWFNAYRAMTGRDLDAVLHVGDWFYEGAGQNSAIGRPHDPPHETVTLADYRRRHAQYRTDPDLAEVMRQHPFIVVWDDHESANNGWLEGAGNHQPETEGDWGTRKAAAARAYAEWMPIRLPDPADPLTIWRRFAFGDLLDLFMLDTRLQRSHPEIEGIDDPAADDPDRSMLGAAQLAWLREGMAASAAAGTRWRVLGQQTMLSPHRGFTQGEVPLPYLPPEVAEELGIRQGGGHEGTDNWSAYAHERNGLMAHWRDNGIGNNIVLSGDIHTAWAAEVVEDPYTPFNGVSPDITGVPGYNALTGAGAVATEFVAMSVTSNNAIDFVPEAEALTGTVAEVYNQAVAAANPNVKRHNVAIHGFVLIDITRERVTGEFWQTGPAGMPLAEQGRDARLDSAWQTTHGSPGAPGTDHLTRAGGATPERADRPALAPGGTEPAEAGRAPQRTRA